MKVQHTFFNREAIRELEINNRPILGRIFVHIQLIHGCKLNNAGAA